MTHGVFGFKRRLDFERRFEGLDFVGGGEGGAMTSDNCCSQSRGVIDVKRTCSRIPRCFERKLLSSSKLRHSSEQPQQSQMPSLTLEEVTSVFVVYWVFKSTEGNRYPDRRSNAGDKHWNLLLMQAAVPGSSEPSAQSQKLSLNLSHSNRTLAFTDVSFSEIASQVKVDDIFISLRAVPIVRWAAAKFKLSRKFRFWKTAIISLTFYAKS